MMLIVLRILSILLGAGTAWRVIDGSMTTPMLKVPELAVGAALVIAAVMPRGIASTALIAANTFALGVFSVALAGYLVPGRPVDPLLMASMAISLSAVLLLFPRGSHH